MGRLSRYLLPALLLAAGVGALLIYAIQMSGGGAPETAPIPPSPTPPGAGTTASASATASATLAAPTAAATATIAPATVSDTPAAQETVVSGDEPLPLPLDDARRFGVTATMDDVGPALAAGLPFGSYATWWVSAEPERPHGVHFWQMIRLQEDRVRTPWHEIDAALAANRGAIWLIGNEPDVVSQDNVPPQTYARLYHQLYTHIKERDPSALVAIGGVSQPTPLRRAYLDVVLDSYEEYYGQPMPVDVWNVHAFILREERDSWGIGIPPGMSDELAIEYEIEDHLDMDIFRQNLIDFRRWMARRGYGDRPLVVSEYGFLMPNDYGFPPDDVADFLTATFDFFLTARDESGYPDDDDRLVQWWFWFMLAGAADDQYAPSFLYDRDSGDLTLLGRAYAGYVREHLP
ncbi:MAG TPA: hypothetical protein VK879_06320 [Candidatus Sulfomarinibacteraceae bacterium]|nr:hypothetical protein [Candidatus Sulfomarinibacteraceae bacterium]